MTIVLRSAKMDPNDTSEPSSAKIFVLQAASSVSSFGISLQLSLDSTVLGAMSDRIERVNQLVVERRN
jgi:hypothetical protein